MASDSDKPTPKNAGPGEAPKGPGSVRHDARGNAVWQWALDSGKQAIESTSRLLKRLEVPGLKLEEDAGRDVERDAPEPAADQDVPGKSSKPAAKPRGYDPYGERREVLNNPAASRPPAPTRKPAAAPAARPSFWQRLFRKD